MIPFYCKNQGIKFPVDSVRLFSVIFSNLSWVKHQCDCFDKTEKKWIWYYSL